MVGNYGTVTGSTTGGTWTIWNDVYITQTTATVTGTSSTGSSLIWTNLAQTSTTSATTTWIITAGGTDSWVVWNNQQVTRQLAGAPYVPRKKTDAEVQAELKQQEKWKREADERAAKELAAKQRAEKLLLESLTPEQREDLQKKACFYMHTQSGRKYRIDRRTHGNIHVYDENDKIVRRLCAQPPGVPVDDAILAQKLALETDEPAFLRVANELRY